jgi:hypothetical protein
MGIRINTAVAYGVQFTKEESQLYKKTIKGKHRNFLLMEWVEKALSIKSDRYSCCNAHDFRKFTRNHEPIKPYRPFWDGWSKKKIAKTDIIYEAAQNLIRHHRLSEGLALDKFKLWEPDGNGECKPPYILSIINENERNYAREVDYALVDYFKIAGTNNKIIVIKGRYPWEAGTTKTKGGTWITLNGQHMIQNLAKPLLHKILSHPGPKEDFIKLKKNIWDLHHGTFRPYPIYSGDGWWGTDFHFSPVDLLYQVTAKLVGIKYDVMRLQKFLCFYWS